MNHAKPTLLGILAYPTNRSVSAKFFRFSFMLLILPLGFILLNMRVKIVSLEISAIIAVFLLNAIMGVYAWEAYWEEVKDYNKKCDPAPPESVTPPEEKKTN
jgi:hypothetical protein